VRHLVQSTGEEILPVIDAVFAPRIEGRLIQGLIRTANQFGAVAARKAFPENLTQGGIHEACLRIR
jgi:hypothetical protein